MHTASTFSAAYIKHSSNRKALQDQRLQGVKKRRGRIREQMLQKCTPVDHFRSSYCVLHGNDSTERMTELGTEEDQQENSVIVEEIKTIPKSQFKTK